MNMFPREDGAVESKYLSMQLRLMGRGAEIMRIFCSREGRVLNRSVALIRPFRIKLSYSPPTKFVEFSFRC